MTIQATKKISYRTGSYIVANGVSLGLNIDTVESKSVLINHPIDAVITTTSNCPTRSSSRTPKAHTEE